MSKAEELRSLARQLDDESIDWHDYPHAAAALREYAASLERKPVDNHDSDCATHNMPAYPNGQCDCRLAHSHPPRSEPPKMTDAESMEEKSARNCRVSDRYDELTREGRHGHYETMFRVVREEVALRDKQWRGEE